MRPEGERVCFDPYAEIFLSTALRRAENIHSALAQRISEWESLFPGVCDAIVARTRFIDDCLEEAIKHDLRQVIILGAGYDTRALRFDRLKKDVTIFELDHPATQKEKLDRYRRNDLGVPDYVTFLPVDFEKQDFGDVLRANGYDGALTSIFIWEGMTYYVSGETVEHTLTSISRNAAGGSSVVFDYFPPSVAAGTSPLVEARALRAALKRLGEDVVFGLDPRKIADVLDGLGFDLVRNLSAEECRRLYFTGVHRHRKLSAMFVFAQARVKHNRNRFARPGEESE